MTAETMQTAAERERGQRLALTMGEVAVLLQQASALVADGEYGAGLLQQHRDRFAAMLLRAEIDVTGLRRQLSEDVPGVGIVDPARPDDAPACNWQGSDGERCPWLADHPDGFCARHGGRSSATVAFTRPNDEHEQTGDQLGESDDGERLHCWRCGFTIEDPEHMHTDKGPRHLNACPVHEGG